jgi:hypothetical protein
MPALFVAGSKLNHTCTGATTFYDSGCSLGTSSDAKLPDLSPGCPAAQAEFVATRDVAAGEELTLSYLLVGRLQSTAARRAALVETKGFFCACGRCAVEPDWFRGLPCPRCSRGVVIAAHPRLGPAATTSVRDSEVTVPSTNTDDTAGRIWGCEECGAVLGTLDQASRECRWTGRGESTTAATWEGAEEEAAAAAGRRSWSLGTLQQRYIAARAGLGPWHWLPNMALLEVAGAYCEVLAAGCMAGSEAAGHGITAELDRPARDYKDSDWADSKCPVLLVAAADNVAACALELVVVARWLLLWVGRSPEEPYQVRQCFLDVSSVRLLEITPSLRPGDPSMFGRPISRCLEGPAFAERQGMGYLRLYLGLR